MYIPSPEVLSSPFASCVILMSLFASNNTCAASQNTWSWSMAETNVVLKDSEGKGKIQQRWRRKWRNVRSWEIYKVAKLAGAQEHRTSVLDSFPVWTKACAQQPKRLNFYYLAQAAWYEPSPASETREHRIKARSIPFQCHVPAPPQYSAGSWKTTQPSWRADAGCRFLYLRNGDSHDSKGHVTAISHLENRKPNTFRAIARLHAIAPLGIWIKLLSGLTSARISINLRMTSGGAHRAQAKDNAGKCAGKVEWFLTSVAHAVCQSCRDLQTPKLLDELVFTNHTWTAWLLSSCVWHGRAINPVKIQAIHPIGTASVIPNVQHQNLFGAVRYTPAKNCTRSFNCSSQVWA